MPRTCSDLSWLRCERSFPFETSDHPAIVTWPQRPHPNQLARRGPGLETLSYERYRLELAQHECQVRRQNRVGRLPRPSHLPLAKDLANFDLQHLPAKVARQVKTLLNGTFLDRKENLLALGKPGSRKTHLRCAIGQELIRNDRKAYFRSCGLVVQELLIAKRDLKLSRVLKRLDGYDALILDDLGYVPQSREEMEVLFTLLAERCERGRVMIPSRSVQPTNCAEEA